jgi:hypothetical protein
MTEAVAIARGFRAEILKLAAQPPEQPPSRTIDGLCEVFDKEKPRTPKQRAQELADKTLLRAIALNPQMPAQRHSHLVHSDPGMTTPGM